MTPPAHPAVVVDPTVRIEFAWGAVVSATAYIVEIGTAIGLTDVWRINTGSTALTLAWFLFPGVYYWRVRGVVGGVPTDPSDEQVVYVPTS
jgi:hypothetical protein